MFWSSFQIAHKNSERSSFRRSLRIKRDSFPWKSRPFVYAFVPDRVSNKLEIYKRQENQLYKFCSERLADAT